jgi:hypothetical protein
VIRYRGPAKVLERGNTIITVNVLSFCAGMLR